MDTKKKLKFIHASMFLSQAFLISPAFGQTATPSTPAPAPTAAPTSTDNSATDGNQSLDIVVTAQRRSERLRDVPGQVTAVTAERLQQMNVTELVGLVERLPAISYQQIGDPRTNVLSIRGVSTIANVPGVEPDAAIVIDGETLARNSQLNMDLGEIERVELLEGPQGTLFGKNAVAGMLNIVTAAPSLSAGLSGKTTIGIAEHGDYRFKGNLNLPVSETAAAMVDGYWSRSDGWVSNAHPGVSNGGKGYGWGLRGQFKWEPSSRFSALVRVETSRRVIDMPSTVLVNLNQADVNLAGGGANTPLTLWYNNLLQASGITLPLVNNDLSYLVDDRIASNARNFAFSGTASYDLGGPKLIYAGSYRNYRLYSNDNQLGVAENLSPLQFAGDSNYKTVQQELRIESPSNNRLRYVGGLYFYSLVNYRRSTDVECYNAEQKAQTPNLTSYTAFNCANYAATPAQVATGGFSISDYASTVTTKNYAVFGQIDFDIFKNLTIFAGGRWLHENQTMTYQTFADDTRGPAYLMPFSASSTKSRFIDREGIRYKAGSATFFITHATGWKGVAWDNGAGKNISQFIGPAAFAPTPPEFMIQYEAGVKGDFLDRKVSYGLTVFHMRDHNYQARVSYFNPALPIPTLTRLQNAGTLGSDGVEASMDFRPDDHLTAGLSLNWVNARFLSDNYINCNQFALAMGDCIQGAGTQLLENIKGRSPTNAPKFGADAYAQYGFNIDGDWRNTFRLDYRHRSSQTNTISPDPYEVQPAYGLFDLSYTLTSPGKDRKSVV